MKKVLNLGTRCIYSCGGNLFSEPEWMMISRSFHFMVISRFLWKSKFLNTFKCFIILKLGNALAIYANPYSLRMVLSGEGVFSENLSDKPHYGYSKTTFRRICQ